MFIISVEICVDLCENLKMRLIAAWQSIRGQSFGCASGVSTHYNGRHRRKEHDTMGGYQLDPQSVVGRVQASGLPARVPTLRGSLLRGALGFILVSIAGFAPWAVAGGWFYRHMGEAGMYIACALVFMGTAGLLMHRLIIGPGSLIRFYLLFTPAFGVYSVAWIVGWMTLRGHLGGIVGLLAGTALMGVMIAQAFDARRQTFKVIAALFVLNSAGYFFGGVVEGALLHMEGFPGSDMAQAIVAKSSWGVFYGAGLGAGLGWAFYLCQGKTRALLEETNTRPRSG
ncbi:MAG: hypothetical protein JNK74_25360 [Candidatus Hydrogenedentes bacterium]|nr:hypothetical protein [Candidatus Hydrogenedentota bacterium]